MGGIGWDIEYGLYTSFIVIQAIPGFTQTRNMDARIYLKSGLPVQYTAIFELPSEIMDVHWIYGRGTTKEEALNDLSEIIAAFRSEVEIAKPHGAELLVEKQYLEELLVKN